MGARRRSDAIRRISQDGWKEREAIGVVLSSIVLDLRDLLREKIPPGDAALVQQLFTEANKIFTVSMNVDPPMDPAILRERLASLRPLATGRLERFGERIDKALQRAEKL